MWSGAIPQHPVETTDQSFETLGLSDGVLRVLFEIGFEHPTRVQAAVIPLALAGRDVVGLADTRSGKTAAFGLPLVERLRRGRGLRGLILSPTREIALQTQSFLELFGEGHGLWPVVLIGGVSLKPQADELRLVPDLVVATPGRLIDPLERGNLELGEISELVLDEADHMLDLGFWPQVQRILQHLPERRHTMMFSATMPEPVERLTRRFLHDPVRVDQRPQRGAAEGISHRLYLVEPEDKKSCLLALLHQEPGPTLVFIRRRTDAEWLSRVLDNEGHPVARIHADLTQAQRIQALDGFRSGEHRILVATDVAARGIDVPGIEHIINFDLPDTVEDYIHRAGRTARGTAVGVVSSIGTWQDKPIVAMIERRLGQTLPRSAAPGVEPYEELRVRSSVRGGKRRLR